jgi:hypothetical protein
MKNGGNKGVMVSRTGMQIGVSGYLCMRPDVAVLVGLELINGAAHSGGKPVALWVMPSGSGPHKNINKDVRVYVGDTRAASHSEQSLVKV